MSFTRAATLGRLVLVLALVWPRPLASAPIPVRFVQGSMHGFLILHTANGPLLASGDLLQVDRGGEIESRMVFRFKDGSVFDERVMFTQQRVFTMQIYRLVQRGPTFPKDTEISRHRDFAGASLREVPREDHRPQGWEGEGTRWHVGPAPRRLQWHGPD